MIILILAGASGFLFARGVLPWSPPLGSGADSALSFIFQSQYSVIYTIVFFLLLGSILYWKELARWIQSFSLRTSGATTHEEVYTEPALSNRMKQTEQKMADTEQALTKFSRAIEKYAAHLSSHTGAIQGLNAASHELQKGAEQQNRILMRLVENADNQPTPKKKIPHWKIEPTPHEPSTSESPTTKPPVHKPENPVHPEFPVERKSSYPPGCARNRLRKTEETQKPEPEMYPDISPRMPEDIVIEPESLHNVRKYVANLRAMSGRAINRKNLASEALAAEERILKAIKNLNARLDESEIQE